MKIILLAIIIKIIIFPITPAFANSFDFKNSTYIIKNERSYISGAKFKMKDGEWKDRSEKYLLIGKPIQASIVKIQPIDFDNDGKNEFVVEIVVEMAMDIGAVVEFFIFKNNEREILTQIFDIETLRNGHFIIDEKKRSVIIVYPDSLDSDPVCCPSLTTKDIYQWRNNTIKLTHRKSYKKPYHDQ